MNEEQTVPPSWLSRWNALQKLVGFVILMLAIAAANSLLTASLALAIGLVLVLSTGASLKETFVRCLAIALFLLPCLFVIPLTATGDRIQIASVSFSREGFLMAVLIYLRAFAIILTGMALLQSTRIPLLFRAAEQMRCPRVLIQIALLAYRYVYTLRREWSRVREALATRAFVNRSTVRTWNTWASVVGMTLIRSNERTERLCHAMQCRGYQGHMVSLVPLSAQPCHAGKLTLFVLMATTIVGLDLMPWAG